MRTPMTVVRLDIGTEAKLAEVCLSAALRGKPDIAEIGRNDVPDPTRTSRTTSKILI
jgi:hypothetical protein